MPGRMTSPSGHHPDPRAADNVDVLGRAGRDAYRVHSCHFIHSHLVPSSFLGADRQANCVSAVCVVLC